MIWRSGAVPALEALVDPHYPKAGSERQPLVCGSCCDVLVQKWFNLRPGRAAAVTMGGREKRRLGRPLPPLSPRLRTPRPVSKASTPVLMLTRMLHTFNPTSKQALE